MCGRFTLTSSGRELAERFKLGEPPDLAPRYNIAPGQGVAVVRMDSDDRSRILELRRWGLVPSWAKDARAGYRAINARSETVAEKPTFRSAFRRRRCLIPADGFFEWQYRGSFRQPWYVRFIDGPLAFAGLYESWRGPDGEIVGSCAIITTAADRCFQELHDRVPVILPPDAHDRWLDARPREPTHLFPLLRPPPVKWLEPIAVRQYVNDASHDDPQCLEPARWYVPAQRQQGLF